MNLLGCSEWGAKLRRWKVRGQAGVRKSSPHSDYTRCSAAWGKWQHTVQRAFYSWCKSIFESKRSSSIYYKQTFLTCILHFLLWLIDSRWHFARDSLILFFKIVKDIREEILVGGNEILICKFQVPTYYVPLWVLFRKWGVNENGGASAIGDA